MKNLIKALISALLPQRCAYCGAVISAERLMCGECEKSLPRITGEVCAKCGREKDSCSCKGAEMYFDRLVAPFYFSGSVRKGIHAFKFRNSPGNAHAYCDEMAKTVLNRYAGVKFNFITEVPMTEKSRKRRGYNQCRLLAKGLGELLGVEYKEGVLVKLYETEKQHGLSYFLRKGNLTGVFSVTDPELVSGKTVLLCDDISTSGETLNECAKMLWLCGADKIYCSTVALTVKKRRDDKKTEQK